MPSGKREQANELLIEIYDRVEGNIGQLIITGWPARDSSGRVPPQLRDLKDMLLSDGLIEENASGALGITVKGILEVERLFAIRALKFELDAPFPTNGDAIRKELDHWVRRQNDGQPGSIHWEQVQARIDQLRYLDRRAMEGEELAKKQLSSSPLLAPEKALKILESQIASAEKLRSERFGSALREEWKTTAESALARAFSQGDPVISSFGGAQAFAISTHDSDAKLRQTANETLDTMLAVLRSAVEQLKWQLPDVTEAFHPAGSQHDAYVGIRSIVEAANTELLIVDTYVDGTLWSLLKNVRKPLTIRILTQNMKDDFALEAKHFVAQHGGYVEIRTTRDYHDRFVVVDRTTVWHLGASIKDAGKKAFAMTEIQAPAIRKATIADVDRTWNGATPVPI
jgi:hypothetical protein